MIAYVRINGVVVGVVTRISTCDCTAATCGCSSGYVVGNDDPFTYYYQRRPDPVDCSPAAAAPARQARPEHRQRWAHRPGPVPPARRRPCY